MDQTTDTTNHAAEPSFDKPPTPPSSQPVPPLPPTPPLGRAEAFPGESFSGTAYPDGTGRPTGAPGSAGSRFRLQRSRTDRMLGGVCGGLAQSLDVDAGLLRIGLVVLTVLGAGFGVVLYVAAWILAPWADQAV